jgi:hypothetical protein
MDTHALWAYLHILLLVYWLGADVGLWLAMAMVKDPKLSFETRATLIRLAFYIDLFPRVTFALILPVGMHLARNLDLYPISDGLLTAGWIAGLLWAALHVTVILRKGTPLAKQLTQLNKGYEAAMGLLFVGIGTISLAADGPIDAPWFALKLLLFGLIFWVILGIDTVFQPFTTILRMGPHGSTPAQEAIVTEMTNRTMAWAGLLYLLIAAVAFLGRVKPIW